jgi:hypothetical protein
VTSWFVKGMLLDGTVWLVYRKWGIMSFLLPLLVWPLVLFHFRCRRLLLNLITLSDTHTHTHSHTLSRTPLGEGPAYRRDHLSLTTHNIHNRTTSMPPAGFEPRKRGGARPQTHLDRAATRIGLMSFLWGIFVFALSFLPLKGRHADLQKFLK